MARRQQRRQLGPGLWSGLLTLAIVGGSWSAAVSRESRIPQTLDEGASCVDSDCHASVVQHTYPHWRGFEGECRDCHEQAGSAHEFSLEDQPDLCTVCHDSVLSGAVGGHEPAQESCVDCHNPHGAARPSLLADAQPELCYLCHDEEAILLGDHSHEPVGTGECTSCHNPHESPHPKLLVASGQALCETCHDEMKAHLAQSPVWHEPLRESGCGECHLPHASQHASLLKKSFPDGPYSAFAETNYALCFACHDSKLATSERTRSETGFRDGGRNLHFVHVNKAEKGRSCQVCHNVHATAEPLHVAENAPYGGWDMPIGFEGTSTGGSCQPGCHAAESYDRDPAPGVAVGAHAPGASP